MEPLETLDVAMLTGIQSILKNTELGDFLYDEIEAQAGINRPYKYTMKDSGIFNTFMASYFFHRRH